MLSEFERRRHSVTKLRLHLIFTTKYRRKVMTSEILAEVMQNLHETAEKIGCIVVDMNGEADYVHLQLIFPTDLSIASIVNSLKSISSRFIRKQHPDILQEGKTGLFWSRSYFAATTGNVTDETLNAYIDAQTEK